MKQAQEWINKLELESHPEGGYFRENFRSSLEIPKRSLPSKFAGHRNGMTSIYYLIEVGDFSSLHRIHSDEVWYFHLGHPLTIEEIDLQGERRSTHLGFDWEQKQSLSHVVPSGHWFGAKPSPLFSKSEFNFSLVSCAVCPGFDFKDFELAQGKILEQTYPKHCTFINQFTRS